jgi:large subunit ribosomal protein L1
MEKTELQKALTQAKAGATDRKFVQSYDIIVNLKDVDLKKPEQQVDFYFQLPHGCGKPKKICGLIGGELLEQATGVLDKAIVSNDFEKLTKKQIKQLSTEYDYFVAQANIMPKVAATFGRVLGPRNKMPNPKAGCVVAPKANLAPLKEQLQKTIRLKAKVLPVLQGAFATTAMTDDQVITNFESLYQAVIRQLPKEINNVAGVYIKLTMGKPVKVI